MSLAIDTNSITAVLLTDGWHDVMDESFDLDSYEFTEGRMVIHGGGQSGVCAVGFQFTDDYGFTMCGPLTAILAVKRRR